MSGPPDADGAILVLIAEDEEPIAELLAYVVQDAGYAPLVASHGRQALELARERWPALLIADLMMPYLSGADLIAALAAEAAASDRARPPVILVTGAGPPQARGAGADVVLYKPFQVADLEALLHRFLTRAPMGADGASLPMPQLSTTARGSSSPEPKP